MSRLWIRYILASVGAIIVVLAVYVPYFMNFIWPGFGVYFAFWALRTTLGTRADWSPSGARTMRSRRVASRRRRSMFRD